MLTANIFNRNTHVHGYCILDTTDTHFHDHCILHSTETLIHMTGAINALKNKNTYSHPTAINTLYRNTYFTGPLPISCYMYTHSKPSAVLHSTDTYFHANSCATPCRNTHSHVHCRQCTLQKQLFIRVCRLHCTEKHIEMPIAVFHSTKKHFHIPKDFLHFRETHSHIHTAITVR